MMKSLGATGTLVVTSSGTVSSGIPSPVTALPEVTHEDVGLLRLRFRFLALRLPLLPEHHTAL